MQNAMRGSAFAGSVRGSLEAGCWMLLAAAITLIAVRFGPRAVPLLLFASRAAPLALRLRQGRANDPFNGRRHLRTGLSATIIAVLLSLHGAAAVAQEAELSPYPLDPPDTSSPRATLRSFVANMNAVYQAYVSGHSGERIAGPFRRAVACLNLSEVPASLHGDVGGFSVLLLKEILDRIAIPDASDIPDTEEVVSKKTTSWTIPRTEIVIGRSAEGEFLFTPRTVDRLLEFYERSRHLPYKPDSSHNLLGFYYDNPGGRVPLHWAERLPKWSMARFFDRPLWKWLSLVAFFAVAAVVSVFTYRLARAWDRRVEDNSGYLKLAGLALTLGVVFWAWALDVFVDDIIGLRGPLEAGIKRGALVVAFSAAVLALFAFLEVIANGIVASNRIRTTSAQAHFVRIVLRVVGIGLSVFLVIEASEYIGWAVAPVLAGLGVGGLAVALAARPTIENILGGLTLFLDAPARVGDFCRFGDRVGTLEEVGLRSTRIRSLDRTVISVPNAEFSQMPIENYSRRDAMLFRTVIGLRYETTADQLRFVLAELRQMLIGHPQVSPEPARARFQRFGASSLDIEIFAYVRSKDWNQYLAIREDLNLRIIDIVRASGTSIAFPSQTLYWSKDAGLDPKLGREAEDRVAGLREAGQLPFPEFAADLRMEIEDTLDYPPRGSPDHRGNEERARDAQASQAGAPRRT